MVTITDNITTYFAYFAIGGYIAVAWTVTFYFVTFGLMSPYNNAKSLLIGLFWPLSFVGWLVQGFFKWVTQK